MLTNSGDGTGTEAERAANRGAFAASVLVALIVFGALDVTASMLVRLWPFTVDDTFITLRYSRHLAAGLGPVWNAGLVHDEGYTSPLWTALLAVPHLLHLDAEFAAKVLSLLAYIATLGTCGALARVAVRGVAPATGARMAWAAAVLLGLAPSVAVHAVSGMETMAFTLALTLLALACARALETGAPWRPVRLALLALALGLARPEGHLIAGVMLAALAALLPRERRVSLARTALLGWLIPAALYMAWRWSYYGAPLPLPFYVKVAQVAALAGAPRVLGFLGEIALGIGVPLALGLAPPPRPLRPALIGAAALLLLYTVPEHLMGYHYRYLVPASPILFALAGAGLARFEQRLAARWASRVAAPIAGIIAIACGFALFVRSEDVIASRRAYAESFDRAHRALAARLAALPPGRIALSDAGVIPYRTDWPAFDLVGLNNRHVARTHDRSPETVFAFHPDVLVLASQDSARFIPFGWNTYETPLLDAAAARGFQFAARYRFHDRYWLWVIVDPASAAGRALLAAP